MKDPNKDLLVPIIFAIDEFQMKMSSMASACPVNFTTSIFGLSLCNHLAAWQTLGYVYDFSIQEKTKLYTKKRTKENGEPNDPTRTKERKHQRLQKIYEALFESLVKAEQDGSLDNVEVTLGSYTKNVNIKAPVMFFIGDMQGGDKLCGTTIAYGKELERPCRKCDIRGKIWMIQMLSATQYLREKFTNL